MTTYQDPPLQSRRAVRQGERSEAQPSSPFAPPQVPRTAAGAGEPLSYVTQNRPPLPAYDQAPPRGPRAAEENEAVEQGTADERQQPQPAQGFRPRDYSPEARTAPPAWSPEHDRASGIVEYHTQARADVTPPSDEAAEPAETAEEQEEQAPEAAAPAAPTSLAASLAGEPSEQTFTRRELRALREAHGIVPADTTVTPVVRDAAPAETASPDPAAPSVPADGFPTRRGRRAAETRADIPELVEPAPVAPTASPSVPLTPTPDGEPHAVVLPPAPVEPVAEVAPAAPSVAPTTPPEGAAPAAPVSENPAPFPFSPPAPAGEPTGSASAPPAAPAAATPVAPAPVAPAAPTTGERPIGHWTTQSDLDDRTQAGETTISRRIGTGALTTNALVLPSLPGHDMSTGEVMMTGTVALPAALAETGAHSAIDESDIDHLLDPGDHQLVHTDSVPISAFKAVSSHSGNRQQLIANAKPNRGNRVLTALIISAGGMVVVTVTLLVVALVNGGI